MILRGGNHLAALASGFGQCLMVIGWVATIPGALIAAVGSIIADQAPDPFGEPYGDVVTRPEDFEVSHSPTISPGGQHGHG